MAGDRMLVFAPAAGRTVLVLLLLWRWRLGQWNDLLSAGLVLGLVSLLLELLRVGWRARA